LNEAHNGYLETYLDGGLIALFLLLAVLFVSFKRLLRLAATGGDADAVRLIFLMIGVFYNWTEVAFARLCMIWVFFLLMIINYPGLAQATNRDEVFAEDGLEDADHPVSEPDLENSPST
jgi:exopolysaccharide production protein ExoQ